MKADKNKEKSLEKQDVHISVSHALDDEQRVKVLSPGTLVMKRFFRNKLAMAGFFILITMFLFSFVGGFFTPYGESQVFRKNDIILKDFAGMTLNQEFQFTRAEGKEFSDVAGAKMILALNQGEDTFEEKGVTYSLIREGEDLYQIAALAPVVNVLTIKGKSNFTEAAEGVKVTEALKRAYEETLTAGGESFELEGTSYYITKNGKQSQVSIMEKVALASKKIFHPSSGDAALSYDFKLEAQKAMNDGKTSFTLEQSVYQVELEEETGTAVISREGLEYALASSYSIRAEGSGSLSIDFIKAAQNAVAKKQTSFHYEEEQGNGQEYVVGNKDGQYRIRSEQNTQLNDTFSKPGKAHWLGTDGHGMDVLTRLMYGGRISLMIGFVAIAIEIFIGVLIGGMAGYFGKWADTLLMRVVDVVICIPAMPLYIIVGAIMDFYQIDPRVRIYLLCAILGLISWPPIARMVRGQILSLREQEFMTAAEATGIRVSRRIFKHLIPNVIPNLIVIATMGLGEIIIMEATLSFLGIGVKFPYASWGNIINSVNDIFVMTNYWYVWIPAGFLILITVLGFNFVGDGLRDAFDPKMKR